MPLGMPGADAIPRVNDIPQRSQTGLRDQEELASEQGAREERWGKLGALATGSSLELVGAVL